MLFSLTPGFSPGPGWLSLFSSLKPLQRFQKGAPKAAEAALGEEEKGLCPPRLSKNIKFN